MASKKTTAAKAATTALVPVTPAALVQVAAPEQALARMPGDGGTVERQGDVTLVTGRDYATHERVVPASEIYFVSGAKPSADGPWLGEADKVAWRDPATGYECIMLREKDGHLAGYVGVPRDHPLWGWEHEAVPADLGIEVHGGLNYSRICEEGPSPAPRLARRLATEARRVCHVPEAPLRYEPLRQAGDHRVEDAHAWWFGFSCDHIYDVVPGDTSHGRRFMAAETGAEYRDDGYVVREVADLAAQLRAIADGVPVPRRSGPPLPAIGLDPQRGG
jgi:hypothetical protein